MSEMTLIERIKLWFTPVDEWAEFRAKIARQDAYEAEGYEAGLLEKTREECPYSESDDSEAWNFWVFGCENALFFNDRTMQGAQNGQETT